LAHIIAGEMKLPAPQPRRAAAPAPGRTLAKASTRAAELLELTQAELAAVLGLSPATVSRMAAGAYLLEPRSKAWELAALFVRLYRALDALVGSNEAQARAWLNGPNLALGGAPRELIARAEGLVRVVHYLDAARGRN
jgi:transcriptional regulator with XRE-family HTH domain